MSDTTDREEYEKDRQEKEESGDAAVKEAENAEAADESGRKADTPKPQEDAADAQEPGQSDEEQPGGDAQPEEKAGEDGASESASKEGKFFKKNKKAEKKDKQQEKIEELEDRVRRQMAEFENFRKRTEKEKSAMFETGARSVIEKILPVVDNFERGLATVSEEEKGSPFCEGMNMVYKQLLGELSKLEVKPIEAVGKEFNPDFHNAVMQVESEEYESGVIAQELQKGYTYRDTVVRHSMVAVVQ